MLYNYISHLLKVFLPVYIQKQTATVTGSRFKHRGMAKGADQRKKQHPQNTQSVVRHL